MSVLLCNGEPADAAALGIAAQVNYGHFTSLRCVDGAVRGLDLHLQRLRAGTRALFASELDLQQVRAQARRAWALTGQAEAWLRLTVFSRQFDFRDPLRPAAPDLLVSAGPASDWTGAPLRVQPVRFQRHRPELKHVGTFALFDLRRQAVAAGWDDVLFIGDDDRVIEGSIWNLGLWDGHGVTWPEGPALRGTQEALLRRGLEAIGVVQQVRPVGLAELGGFSAFACNARGTRAIGAVGGQAPSGEAGWAEVLEAALAACPWQPL